FRSVPLINVDPERVGEDARDPGTAEPRIARLELDDGVNERLARPLRSGRLRARARREQAPVFEPHQGLMKREERSRGRSRWRPFGAVRPGGRATRLRTTAGPAALGSVRGVASGAGRRVVW